MSGRERVAALAFALSTVASIVLAVVYWRGGQTQLEGVSLSFQRRSGEHDQLFGSVTSGDLADALTKKGFNIDRRKIQLHEPLKTVGDFTVPVKLHKDVTAHLKVVIEKEAVEQ